MSFLVSVSSLLIMHRVTGDRERGLSSERLFRIVVYYLGQTFHKVKQRLPSSIALGAEGRGEN